MLSYSSRGRSHPASTIRAPLKIPLVSRRLHPADTQATFAESVTLEGSSALQCADRGHLAPYEKDRLDAAKRARRMKPLSVSRQIEVSALDAMKGTCLRCGLVGQHRSAGSVSRRCGIGWRCTKPELMLMPWCFGQ